MNCELPVLVIQASSMDLTNCKEEKNMEALLDGYPSPILEMGNYLGIMPLYID